MKLIVHENALPSEVIRNRKGNILKTRVSFVGGHSATEVKSVLKAQNPGLTGKELRDKVRDVLTGAAPIARVAAQAAMEEFAQKGMVPVCAEINGKENKGVIKFESVPGGEEAAQRRAVDELHAQVAALKAQLEAAGIEVK